jgi:hypothetical protein
MGEVLENLFDVQGASNLGDISQSSDYLFCPTEGSERQIQGGRCKNTSRLEGYQADRKPDKFRRETGN